MGLFAAGYVNTGVGYTYIGFVNAHSTINGSLVNQFIYPTNTITIPSRVRYVDGLVYIGGLYQENHAQNLYSNVHQFGVASFYTQNMTMNL